MKNIRKLSVLLIAFLMVFTMAGNAFAETVDLIGDARFDGKEVKSSLNADEMAKALSDLQPGDQMTVTVTYQNDYEKDTDWYMANEILQTLEKTDQARKTVEGTGTPSGGGYKYELIHTDKDNKDTVLFSNTKVGGEATPDSMEGLEQATNALDDWFYLETLSQGQKGKLTLTILFEGETEVNDYMDTEGAVNIRFAVNISEEDNPPGEPNHKQKVKTGDPTVLLPYVGKMIIGLVLLVPLFRRKKDKGGEA